MSISRHITHSMVLDTYLSRYNDSGEEREAEAQAPAITVATGTMLQKTGPTTMQDKARSVSAEDPIGNDGEGVQLRVSSAINLDVEHFLQQKVVEQNCRRRRHRQLDLMLDFSLDVEEESALDSSKGVIAATLQQRQAVPHSLDLDRLLFDEDATGLALEDSLMGAELYTTITMENSTGRRSSNQRYRQIREAVLDLCASSDRTLRSLHAHGQRQREIGGRMEESFLKSKAIYRSIGGADEDCHAAPKPPELASSFQSNDMEPSIPDDDFTSWLQSFKTKRPAINTVSKATTEFSSVRALTPPRTPTAPPHFEEDDTQEPASDENRDFANLAVGGSPHIISPAKSTRPEKNFLSSPSVSFSLGATSLDDAVPMMVPPQCLLSSEDGEARRRPPKHPGSYVAGSYYGFNETIPDTPSAANSISSSRSKNSKKIGDVLSRSRYIAM